RALQREQRDKVLGPIKRDIADLEQRIAELEQEKRSTESQLADPALFSDPARSTPLVTAYRDASRKLEELYARWEHKNEELAAAESQRACEGGRASTTNAPERTPATWPRCAGK